MDTTVCVIINCKVQQNNWINWTEDFNGYTYRHTTKMEQIMEHMLAEMKNNQETLMARLEAKDRCQSGENVDQSRQMQAMQDACLEKMETSTEEMEAIVECQKVPNEEATVETIRVLKD